MGQKLTNKYGLPDTLVKACANDTHRVGGDMSVTQIIDAPQVRLLKKRNDYETDVVDNLYMLMGTALHHILERANITSERKRAFILTAETIMSEADKLGEHPSASQLKNGANWLFSLIPVFFPEVEEKYVFEKTMRLDVGKIVLYGTFDLYDKVTGILYDYKFTSCHSYVYPDARKKWFTQTNIYAYMIKTVLGLPVNGIKVVAFFRDWNEYGMQRNSDYPPRQVMEVNIPLGSGNPNVPWDEEVSKYINERVALHVSAEEGRYVPCDGADRWAKAEEFAIKTPGAKKALRVVANQGFANNFIEENRHKYDKMYIEHRPGESRRCEKYCSVSSVCPQFQKEVQDKLNALNYG